MPINDPWELDVTSPVSNSNFAGANVAENCPPSGINNAIRQAGAWLAQATSYQSPALSSSVSTNIAATGTGLYIPITGANAINSFGLVAGLRANAAVLRILEFSSSASLSHGGSIFLSGGVSRKTQPGDVGMYIHEGSADVWREVMYSRAAPADGNFASLSASTFNVTSLSASVINVAGVREFPRFTFMAHKNGSVQNSISNSVTVLTLGTEEWDIGGFFASNAYTPAAGKYRLTAQALAFDFFGDAASFGVLTLGIYKNGIQERATDANRRTSATSSTLMVSCVVDANGTDAFDVRMFNNGSSSVPFNVSGAATKTFFCGERI